MGRAPFFAALSLNLIASCQCVWADGVILNGVSPRSIGRGGTNLAHHDNGGLIFDNPAGMVAVPGNGLFDVGFDVLITDFEYSDPMNPSASDSSGTPLPQVSIIRKTEDGQWAYGVGLFTPAGFSEEYHLEGPPPLVGPRTYESFGALAKILPGLSWQATDQLRIGATLGVGISHAELEAPYFLQDPGPFQGTPMYLDLQGTGAALVWSIGLQYDVSEATTLGLAYQSESRFDLNGSAKIAVPGLGMSRYNADTHIVWPQSLGAGVRHEVIPCHIVSFDAIWFDWSSAFDEFGVTLSNPAVPGFPPLTEHFPLDWRDTVSFRFGYEWELQDNGTLRFGYVYHRNPIPSATLTPLIQATMEHGFSTGYGFQVWDWEIDLAYMFTFGRDVDVGTSQFIGGDFNGSSHSAQTHAVAVSAIKRF